MERKNNKKGFTLAELLIVVAIIAVLVAIAIPIFTSQLEKSREATDLANIRSGYAEVVTAYLTGDTSASVEVPLKQTKDSWQTFNGDDSKVYVGSEINSKSTSSGSSSTTGQAQVKGTPKKGGKAVITIDDKEGTVTIECK